MEDKKWKYVYINNEGESITTYTQHTYYTPDTMILFLNEYLSLKERNEIVHTLPNIYKEKI